MLQICKQRSIISEACARAQELHMSDAIFLCMLEGKLHGLCAVAGIANEKHQVRSHHHHQCTAPQCLICTIPAKL